MDIVRALRARSGTVCVTGAGGKKTTLYALANRTGDESRKRTVLTATVRIPIFDDQVARLVETDDPVSAVGDNTDWPLGIVPERDRPDRYRGYDVGTVDDLAAADVAGRILVKADGARTRLFKAPASDEPQVPPNADVVIPVASVRAVGKPLTEEFIHRPERVAEIADCGLGDELRPSDVVAVLASTRGGLRGIPNGATVVLLLNMVDTEDLRETARSIATGVLDRTDAVEHVVLARMIDDNPLVETVR